MEHVLADPDADLFDGIIVDMRACLEGHRFADADRSMPSTSRAWRWRSTPTPWLGRPSRERTWPRSPTLTTRSFRTR